MICLVLILNILKEIEFFSNKEVNSLYPVYLSIINSPITNTFNSLNFLTIRSI